jgi:hypothetical protein
MADITISFDASGNPNSPRQAVTSKDRVRWHAADPSKTWFISISPFMQHVIQTDNHGLTGWQHPCDGLGQFTYVITDKDPRPALLEKGDPKILSIGGGIIIDN